MEFNKINWYNDYVVNESINESVSSLIGTYSRLKTKYPNHSDFKKWEKQKETWSDFQDKLSQLNLPTEEMANKLVLDISKELRDALEQEENAK